MIIILFLIGKISVLKSTSEVLRTKRKIFFLPLFLPGRGQTRIVMLGNEEDEEGDLTQHLTPSLPLGIHLSGTTAAAAANTEVHLTIRGGGREKKKAFSN